METITPKRRGRPRKDLPVDLHVAEDAGQAAELHQHREISDQHPDPAGAGSGQSSGPKSWADVRATLDLFPYDALITQIEVPFDADGTPEFWSTAAYGCPVVKGKAFVITMSDGTRYMDGVV